MKIKYIVYAVLSIVGIVIIAFGMEFGSLSWKRFFNPRHENVRREVFEQTKSYNEGKIQDLVRYRLQYQRAKNNAEREMIASTLRMMFADFDTTKIKDYQLRTFIEQILRGEL